MRVLLEHIVVLLVTGGVLLLPGAALLSATGIARVLNGYLMPGAALVMTLVPASVLLALTLWLQRPVTWVIGGLAAVTAVAAAWALVLDRRREGAAFSWGRWIVSPLLGAWARQIARPLWPLGALLGGVSYAAGANFNFDTLYHVGVARKLAELPNPSFDNTSRFIDGGANPAYYLPVWHEMIGASAWLAAVDVSTVIWLLPALIVPIVTLTYAGLAFALFRTHAAALVGAVVWVLANYFITLRKFYGIEFEWLPGEVTLDVVIPLTVATLVYALWAVERSTRVRAMVLVAAATAMVIVLHANYIFFVGLLGAGYLVMWALQAPWSRTVVARHVAAIGAVGAVAVAGLAALLPILSGLSNFARGKNDDSLQSLFVDDRFTGLFVVESIDAYHTRSGYMVQKLGAWGVVGLLCVLLAARFRREPFAWYLLGAPLLILTISQSDVLFPLLMGVGSTTAAIRLDQVLAAPVVMGLTLAVLWFGTWAGRMWNRAGRERLVAVAAAVALGAAMLALSVAWKRDQTPNWPVVAAWAGLVAVTAWWAVDLVRRTVAALARRRDDGGASLPAVLAREEGTLSLLLREGEEDRAAAAGELRAPASIDPGRAGLVLAMAAVTLGGAWAIVAAPVDAWRELASRPDHAVQADALNRFEDGIRRELVALPEGSVVLAPPVYSYQMQAFSALYVVGDYKIWLADTDANRPGERRDQLTTFFASDTSDGDRLRLLRETRATHLLIRRRDDALRDFVHRHPNSFTPLVEGFGTQLYSFNPAAVDPRDAPDSLRFIDPDAVLEEDDEFKSDDSAASN